jgi:O-antigen biosynthesis protein
MNSPCSIEPYQLVANPGLGPFGEGGAWGTAGGAGLPLGFSHDKAPLSATEELAAEIAGLREDLQQKTSMVSLLQHQLREAVAIEHQRIFQSRSWRITAPLRFATRCYRRLRSFARRAVRVQVANVRGVIAAGDSTGMATVSTNAGQVQMSPGVSDYEIWMEKFEKPDIEHARAASRRLRTGPLFSVLMPVYNTDPTYLKAAIDSLVNQFYEHWELCIGNDASTNWDTLSVLAAATARDSRIKVTSLPRNGGISAATNQALSIARGEFCVLMDHDDTLAPHALYEIAQTVKDNSDAQFIYSDEDKIDQGTRRYEPLFKPDWSPDLFTSCNYLNHLTAVRTKLLRAVGGFRSEFDGSQDYDLYLRLAEHTSQIEHIAKVLYHWRAVPSSTAADPTAKMSAHVAAQRALAAALERRGIAGTVERGVALGRWRVRYHIADNPLVSVLLPTGGKLEFLEPCLDGLRRQTTYRNLELIIIDNSRGEDVKSLFDMRIRREFSAQYLDFRHQPFNYSILNNRAAEVASGPLLLLLNDDVFPINADWIEAMIEHAQRRDVGAVGVKLLYPDGRLQHAGVVMGLYDCCDHAFKLSSGKETGPSLHFDFPHIVRNCSVVTAACVMLRKQVFLEVDGFDESNLAVAFQDVDLCLKIAAKGYYNVYTPHAKLYHLESVTKDEKVPAPAEVTVLKERWKQWIACDPFYNPNLTRRSREFGVRTEM